MQYYKMVYNVLRANGMELSMADAAYLREMIRDAMWRNEKLEGKRNMDKVCPTGEAVVRWLYDIYGVDFDASYNLVGVDDKDFAEKLGVLIKRRYRPERENL